MDHRNTGFSQLETSIYHGFSIAMLVITRGYPFARAREGALPGEFHLPRSRAGPIVGALVAEARELHLDLDLDGI